LTTRGASARGQDGRILVLAGEESASISEMLAEAGLRAELRPDVATLCEGIREGAGAVLVSERLLHSTAVRHLAGTLSRQPPWSDLPLLVLGSPESTQESGLRTLQALEPIGFSTLIGQPLRPEALVSAVRVALRARRRQYELRDHVAERERREAEMRIGQERFRAALRAAPVVVFNLDRDLRYTWFESEIPRYHGIVIGKTAHEVCERPEDAERLAEMKQRVLETGERQREVVRVLVEGAERSFDLGAEPLRDASGEIVGVTCVAVDVTERVEMEDRLRHQARQLAEADLRREQFLAMLAHELRNPLGPIRNATEILLGPAGARDEARVEWAAQTIRRQVSLMRRILDDLQDVMRITRATLALRPRVLDFSEAVATAVETNASLVEERRHELSVTVPAEPVLVEADPERIDQIVSNLLSNASRYTEPGGHVRVKVEADDDTALLRVRDDGLGIPGDALPRIFELYKQVDRLWYRSQGGLGIGLALVRMLAELHGGSVEARSDGPGLGSEFLVRLPRLARAAPAPAAEPDPVRETGGLHILVVDDNRDSAESLGILLEGRGHEVRIAANGPEALEMARDAAPDVALLDIGLPGMDGFELAERMRGIHRDITLVAVTGYGTQEDRRAAHEAGFDHYLLKPVDMDALTEVLLRT
jgi:PAS domain S-box-containing protein